MNSLLTDELKKELSIDCNKELERIVDFVRVSVKKMQKKGVVIGLSGGLDSSVCAYLLEKALGKRRVLAVLLPERDSASINHSHAHLIAENLGLEIVECDMTQVLEDMGAYKIAKNQLKNKEEETKYIHTIQTGVNLIWGGYLYQDLFGDYYGEPTSTNWKIYKKLTEKATYRELAFQFTKVRLRMVYLYFLADQRNYAVVGTTDKSEYSTGIYCKYGDGANDMQILRHLYKTQIRQLAQYINLPVEIIKKPNTADLYGNLPHSVFLGMSYEELDALLIGMEKGYSDRQLMEIVPLKGVESVRQLKKVGEFVKELPLLINRP